jgi:hypothetical protein
VRSTIQRRTRPLAPALGLLELENHEIDAVLRGGIPDGLSGVALIDVGLLNHLSRRFVRDLG